MLVSKYTHPRTFQFLVSEGFIPDDPRCQAHELAAASALLRGLLDKSADCQRYILKPLILEILSVFYVHQDAQFTLNAYLTDLYPEYGSDSFLKLQK